MQGARGALKEPQWCLGGALDEPWKCREGALKVPWMCFGCAFEVLLSNQQFCRLKCDKALVAHQHA